MTSNRSVLAILLLLTVAGCASGGDPAASARNAAEPVRLPQAGSKAGPTGAVDTSAGTAGKSGETATGSSAATGAGAAPPKAVAPQGPSPAPAGAAKDAETKAAAPKAAPVSPPTVTSPAGIKTASAAAPAVESPAGTETASPAEPVIEPPVEAATSASTGTSVSTGSEDGVASAQSSQDLSLDGDPTAGELNRLADRSQEALEIDGDAGDGDGPEPKRRESDYADRSLQCDVVLLMGREIGRRRRDGDERKTATNKAIDTVVRETGSVRDKRFVFSGRVYGMLIYQLKQEHTPDGFGAYAHAACLILRGQKGIVPADEASEALLDQALSSCESRSRSQDQLNACMAERMEQIVMERGRRS